MKKRFFITKLILFFTFFSSKISGMLVNSKVIAEDVKGAIIEAGNQVTSNMVWPNQNSCFTILGFLSATAGLLFIYRGVQKFIFLYKRNDEALLLLHEDSNYKKRAFLKIFVGMIITCVGMFVIHIFGS